MTLCYIGRTTRPTKYHPNIGTVVCASVDDCQMIKYNAKVVAKWIRAGLVVEHVPVWWVRLHMETTETYDPSKPREAAVAAKLK